MTDYSPAFRETTGADGVAVFPWFPTYFGIDTDFNTYKEGYHSSLGTETPGAPETDVTLPVTMERNSTLRGRVTFPDGRPAPGIRIEARGTRKAFYDFRGKTTTRDDGTYELAVYSEQLYLVSVQDDEWSAPSHRGIVVREGQDPPPQDFQLVRAARLRVSLTVGTDRAPLPGERVTLTELAGTLPEPLRHDRFTLSYARDLDVTFGREVTTDGQGRAEFHVGPGKYTLSCQESNDPREVEVAEGQTIDVALHQERPTRLPITGRVVLASDPQQGLPGATIELRSRDAIMGHDLELQADADGRFSGERDSDRMLVAARSADGKLAGVVEIGPDDTELTIPVSPTVSVKGIVVDASGKPLTGVEISCSCVIDEDIPPVVHFKLPAPINSPEDLQRPFEAGVPELAEDFPATFPFIPTVDAGSCTTDSEGRFEFGGLLLGRKHDVFVDRGGGGVGVASIRPDEARVYDLGTIRIDESLFIDPFERDPEEMPPGSDPVGPEIPPLPPQFGPEIPPLPPDHFQLDAPPPH